MYSYICLSHPLDAIILVDFSSITNALKGQIQPLIVVSAKPLWIKRYCRNPFMFF